jgi:hypothetical protein
MFGAALLSMLARRIGLPYPSLLAVGGAAVALLPMSPTWTLDPQLALTLFVAPVLLDAAYDFSLRDLKRNWVPVAGLAVAAVGVTTAAVALVARWLIPDMPWSIAVALGAIVAPPDAAAATAVMRQIKLPHRIRTILEGESLVNDASALLVYRLAIGAADGEQRGIGQADTAGEHRQQRRAEHEADDPLEDVHVACLLGPQGARCAGDEARQPRRQTAPPSLDRKAVRRVGVRYNLKSLAGIWQKESAQIGDIDPAPFGAAHFQRRRKFADRGNARDLRP